jgi:hypothetical protein
MWGIRMDIEEDIKILQEFTELDRKLRNYKVESDYDNFCERRCVAIDHILAEREEDKKRIKELEVLEDDLKDKRIVYVDTPEFEEKFIAKQKVKDNFNKLITRIKEFKDPERKKYFSIEQIIYLLEQFENKLLEEK